MPVKYVNVSSKLLELNKVSRKSLKKLKAYENENTKLIGDINFIEEESSDWYYLKYLKNQNYTKWLSEYNKYKELKEKINNFNKIYDNFVIMKNLYQNEKIKYPELEGWEFKIHHMGRTALGLTSYRNKTISLSKRTLFYDTLDTNIDTLLHEIAHVLAHSVGGKCHGKIWKDKCRITGANPKRCCSNSLMEKPWFLMCETPGCFVKKYNRRNFKFTKNRHTCNQCYTTVSYKKNENFKDLNQH